MSFSVSGILTAIKHLFTGALTKAIPTLIDAAKAELSNVETTIANFVTTDLGKIAVDSVAAASAKAGDDNARFELAKAQFIADAKTAGHDLSVIGLGIVDWMIQTAYTFTANTVAAAQTATK